MVQILKMSFDASGGMVACGALPVSFDNAVDASTFMKHYLSLAFARGKSVYQRDDAYWWACDETPELQLHRFTIEQ